MSGASEARWKTRREKYGPCGHGGSYARWTRDPLGVRALALVIQLHREEVLSEGQCCDALDIDRVSFRELVDGAANAPTPANSTAEVAFSAEREGSRDDLTPCSHNTTERGE
jgi:hypothetical protein